MSIDLKQISKQVGFYRRHQRIPSIGEVESVWRLIQSNDINGYIELLNWRRHCFLAKNKNEFIVMAKIMEYSKIIFE